MILACKYKKQYRSIAMKIEHYSVDTSQRYIMAIPFQISVIKFFT